VTVEGSIPLGLTTVTAFVLSGLKKDQNGLKSWTIIERVYL